MRKQCRNCARCSLSGAGGLCTATGALVADGATQPEGASCWVRRPRAPKSREEISRARSAAAQTQWGEAHGKTLCVRASEKVVLRFRERFPLERDRSPAATEALARYLDALGRAPAGRG